MIEDVPSNQPPVAESVQSDGTETVIAPMQIDPMGNCEKNFGVTETANPVTGDPLNDQIQDATEKLRALSATLTQKARAEIGDPLNFQGKPLRQFPIHYERYLRDLRELVSITEANDEDDAAIIVFLLSHTREQINQLVWRTQRVESHINPKTLAIDDPGHVHKCPIIDAFHDWRDRHLVTNEQIEESLEIANKVFTRINAARTVPVTKDDDQIDREAEQSGN